MRRYLAALVVVSVSVTACGERGSVRQDGPLSLGGDAGTLCMPSDQGRQFTIGLDRVHNSGGTALTITDVTLVNARGSSLIEAVLLPMPAPAPSDGTRTMVGNQSAYPPRNPSPEWHQRRLAKGVSVDPGQESALVFGITSEASASIDGVDVRYRDPSGAEYVASTSTKIIVKPQCL